MSIITPIDDLRSEASESELSEALNATAFDTATHATLGNLPETQIRGDFVEWNGKTYISVSRSANQRAGSIPS
jgi:hypothetical protein